MPFLREIKNFSKTELETIFQPAYIGQNQDSELHATKKSGLILSEPKLLAKKHGGSFINCHLELKF